MLIKKLNNQFINCDIFYRLIKIFLLCLVGLNLFSINANSKEQKSEWSKRCADESKIETCKIFCCGKNITFKKKSGYVKKL